MIDEDAVAIVLAAGLGTRMHSARPKVMHEVAGQAMLAHVLDAARKAGLGRHIVVTGPESDEVRSLTQGDQGQTSFVMQADRRGTGHAVLTARPAIAPEMRSVFILYGDTPLVRPETILAMQQGMEDADIVLLAFSPEDPTGYGRVVRDASGQVVAIREHADASEEERAISSCWSGLMAFSAASMLQLLDDLQPHNAQGELYLTEIIEIAHARGLVTACHDVDSIDVIGVNSRAELAVAEAHMQARLRSRAMEGGVTLIAPETVHFSYDTVLARDVVVEPNVIFAPGVSVGEGTRIRANCHLEDAEVGKGAIIGPFARLRPGARIANKAHVGNFVEIKNAVLGEGAKTNHLTYIGDASVGADVNIGAGTITCNYDGFHKHRTEIGAGAFVGSNSALVAPVSIGKGAYIASGSVVTGNVEDNALAVARGRQENKPDWANKFRALHARANKGSNRQDEGE